MANTVRVKTRFGPDMFRMPELKPMIGKEVEVVVTEETAGLRHPPDVQEFLDASKNAPMDFDALRKAVRELKEISTI